MEMRSCNRWKVVPCFLFFTFLGISCGLTIRSKQSSESYIRACYYPSGGPEPSVLNVTLCTHIICGFAGISDGVISIGSKEEISRYISTTGLKAKYPDLKVMLSIGGGGNDYGFPDAVSSSANRTRLIKSILLFITQLGFDGLDIDWEFPVWSTGNKKEKPNFVHFLSDFKLSARRSYPKPLLLSIAVGAVKGIIDEGYDIPKIAKYVDFINLMSYDYHDFRLYTPFTGHNSPLFNRSVEHAYFATLNTAWSANYWYQRGMPKEKILVGLPTYGHTFKLLKRTLHGMDAPAIGNGMGNGTVTFPDACRFLKNGGKRMFDKESQVPYAFNDTDWIGYDDYESITAKVNWVKSQGFGGVMTYDLNCDDWQKVCDGQTAFPLHQIIYSLMSS